MLEHAYCGIPTFFAAPFREEIKDLDIALVGVPFDLGVSNRSGTRQGPREIRNQSRLVGFYDYSSRTTPFASHRVTDLGDVPIRNPYNLTEAFSDIESFYRRLALANFDSHCYTAPSLFGCGLEHVCPILNAVEAGLVDPMRTV